MLDYPLVDVLDLLREHLDHKRRAEQQQNIKTPTPRADGSREKVIYRQADDSWF